MLSPVNVNTHYFAMNCRSEVLEVTVESRQVEESMLALLHTILLHRSTGKFHYKKEGTYSIGTVGTQDIDCDFIDFSFVRVSSEELDRVIRRAVAEFKVNKCCFHLLIVGCNGGQACNFMGLLYVSFQRLQVAHDDAMKTTPEIHG